VCPDVGLDTDNVARAARERQRIDVDGT